MVPQVVQDSDAESSDASPQKHRFAPAAPSSGARKAVATGLIDPLLHAGHISSMQNEDHELERNGSDEVESARDPIDSTTRAGVRKSRTTTDLPPDLEHHYEEGNHGAQDLDDDDDDEVVLVRPRKRRKGASAQESSQQTGDPSSAVAFGKSSRDVGAVKDVFLAASQAKSITLSQAANFGLEQLAHNEDMQHFDLIEAPQLRNDLSFTSITSQAAMHSRQQSSVPGHQDSNWFPSLTSPEATDVAKDESMNQRARSRSAHQRNSATIQNRCDATRTEVAVIVPEVERKHNEILDEEPDPQLRPEQAKNPSGQIRKGKKRGRPRKQPETKTEPVDQLGIHENLASVVAVEAPPSGRKKRGRKRKGCDSHPQDDPLKNEDVKEDQDAAYIVPDGADGTEAEAESKDQIQEASKADMHNIVSANDLVAADMEEHNKENIFHTAGLKEKSAPAAKKNASPARDGKLGYRVGLSKRARIAPLLKIVKK